MLSTFQGSALIDLSSRYYTSLLTTVISQIIPLPRISGCIQPITHVISGNHGICEKGANPAGAEAERQLLRSHDQSQRATSADY